MKKGTLFLYLAALFTCIILFGWPILAIVDSAIAATCGINAIQQAVIFNKDKKNYYAQMAFDGLLAKQQNRVFNQYALKSYGCSLPNFIR